MAEFEHIRLEHEKELTWIVLDRPDRANALSNAMLDEFSAAVEDLRSAGGPVLAIRGEGRGFSAGLDVGQVAKPTEADPVGDRERLERNLSRYFALWDHPKPVIAAVHGYCLGGASQMCALADITVVADDATIGEPALPIGGGYIAPVWTPLVGSKRAKELAFIPGNSIDGATAVRWGWANHAVPAAELIDFVRALARRIAMTPPEVLRIKKLSINRAAEAMGCRRATAGVSEMDALLHAAPSVLALRERIAAEGLKAVMADYRGPRTTGGP